MEDRNDDGDLGMQDEEFQGGEGGGLEIGSGSLHMDPVAALHDWHPRRGTASTPRRP